MSDSAIDRFFHNRGVAPPSPTTGAELVVHLRALTGVEISVWFANWCMEEECGHVGRAVWLALGMDEGWSRA